LNALELTGRARTHLVEVPDQGCQVHRHVATPFKQLRGAATKAGFDLVAVSAFRDFGRQLAIWNAKYDKPVAPGLVAIAPDDRIDAILQWSALPGASRHHWGTDMDLIDRTATPPGYRVRLVTEEYAPGGPFSAAAEWLEIHAGRFGFFRPYRGICSGVQAEPWHFSFAPAAEQARKNLTPALLREVLGQADMSGKDAVLARLEDIVGRYVKSIDLP
jgi:LAS superfamily LD-carboxypeptidase LdcB